MVRFISEEVCSTCASGHEPGRVYGVLTARLTPSRKGTSQGHVTHGAWLEEGNKEANLQALMTCCCGHCS